MWNPCRSVEQKSQEKYSSILIGKYFYAEINCFSSHCNFQCRRSNTRLLFQIPSAVIHFYR